MSSRPTLGSVPELLIAVCDRPDDLEGRARVAPELTDEVWGAMMDADQQQDPERLGVAVLIEVDSLPGARAEGCFQQSRS